MNAVLQMMDFSYAYPDTRVPSLNNASLRISSGECVCVTGPSGCGKTTLLMAIQGLLKSGQASGAVSLRKNGWKLDVGMVFQNADTQILCTTVEDEVAFGPENLGFFSRERAEDALRAVGLTDFAKRNVERLSAGEKHRLTIASVISMEPGLLLLDEPTSQLDADGKRKLLEILKRLKEQGHALLITDHNYDLFRFIADRFIFMKNGYMLSDGYDEDTSTLSGMISQKTASVVNGPLAIEVDNLHLSGTNGTNVFNGVNIRINRGELVHLFGQNGAGKSTLLKCIAGLVRPGSGTVHVIGIGTAPAGQAFRKDGFFVSEPAAANL